jgi:two-component system nitrogen regulation sensor histidine kinase GlnL
MRTQLHVPIQVEIIDNGPGISPDIRDHIFDPFVTAKAGGSGLGLAMVASVVADHGGMVEVDSARGRTVFRINFPLADDPAHHETLPGGGEQR